MAPEIKEEHIKEIVKEGIGLEPASYRFVGDPNINVVCEVSTEEGEALMVRVNTDPERVAVLEFQANLLDHVRKQGVPVPEVLHFGNTAIPGSYLVYRKIVGITGDQYSGNTTPVWKQIGEYVHLIHDVRGSKYGKVSFWSGRGTELYDSWSGFVYARVQSLGTALEELAAYGADKRFMEKVLQEISAMGEWETESRLVHGDLALKNVILDQDGIVKGIIDWDEAFYGRAPHFDLSSIILFNYPTERFAFAEGYGFNTKEWQDVMGEMKPALLFLLLDHLVWFVHIDQSESFNEVYWRMHEILAL